MRSAFQLVSTGTRVQIAQCAETSVRPPLVLFRAVIAQYDGDVECAIRMLRGLLRKVDGDDAAIVADMLAPIYVMRGEFAVVIQLADQLARHGWLASAYAFKAIVAATSGEPKAAQRFVELSREALDDEMDDINRFRVLQRLALAEYYRNAYVDALDYRAHYIKKRRYWIDPTIRPNKVAIWNVPSVAT